MKLIGREKEIKELENLYKSDSSEFVAVYGRRRVGKTFLIKEVFKNRLTFWHTGLSPFDRDKTYLLRDQLQTFYYSLQDYGLTGCQCPKTWLEAFRLLQQLLLEKDNGSRQVVFIDEMPWMDTARSHFIPAFEYFWNGWASKRDNILLIVCGSATSWIENNIINNKGGLYNRLTSEIRLSPFTLKEAEDFFRAKNIAMSRYEIATAYMVFGGIPHYLNLFEKGLSTAQNIDNLLFAKNAKLKDEFVRLFGSLFKNADEHISTVRTLSGRRSGFSRKEILEKTGIKDGGGATEIIKGLQESDFITEYKPFGCGNISRYKLTDPFCLFYLQFIDNKPDNGVDFWQKNNLSSTLNTWRGLAFEMLCFSHISQIKRKLGISGVSTSESAWVLQQNGKTQSQTDMLIDRSDNVVNLCEIKFYNKPFTIDKKYDDTLRERVQTLIEAIPRKKTIHLTFIASFGLKQNAYSGQVQSVVTLDDLFV
jgi:hypothetical protein